MGVIGCILFGLGVFLSGVSVGMNIAIFSHNKWWRNG